MQVEPGLVRATRAPFVDWVICTENVGADVVNAAVRVTPPAATVTVVKPAFAVLTVRFQLPSEAIGSSEDDWPPVVPPVRSLRRMCRVAPGGEPYIRAT